MVSICTNFKSTPFINGCPIYQFKVGAAPFINGENLKLGHNKYNSVINLVTDKISGYQNNIKTKILGGNTNNKPVIRLLLH